MQNHSNSLLSAPSERGQKLRRKKRRSCNQSVVLCRVCCSLPAIIYRFVVRRSSNNNQQQLLITIKLFVVVNPQCSNKNATSIEHKEQARDCFVAQRLLLQLCKNALEKSHQQNQRTRKLQEQQSKKASRQYIRRSTRRSAVSYEMK